MTSLREFFSLPTGSRGLGRDAPVGVDELGRQVYRTPIGQQYAATTAPRVNIGEAIAQGAQAFRESPSEATRNVARALLEGAWNGIEAPGNALRGETVTYGDVADTALDWGVMSALTPAPRGAIRAGSLVDDAAETPAQTVARLLREGRASEVTDDMMAAVDPQEMARLYESGATGMPMPLDEASRMARAREMGFDTDAPLYHGTGADFSTADPWRSRGMEGGQGFFTAEDPYVAGSYADLAEDFGRPQVQPLLGRNSSHVYADFEGARWDQFAPDIDPSRWGASGNSWNDYDPFGWQDLEPEDWAGEYYTTDDIARVAREDGYSGARFYDVEDHVSGDDLGASNVRVDFDPRNIRSRFARFDPRLSHLANLSAGIGAGAVMLPYLSQEDNTGLMNYVEKYQ